MLSIKFIKKFFNGISASLSASSATSSSSSGTNGGNTQFAQTQNTAYPATGYGYNYGGGIYPSYPVFPYGQINPGNQIQTSATLNSRNSFGDDESAPINTGQAPFNPQPYGTNAIIPPVNYNPYLNNLQQQQNAYV